MPSEKSNSVRSKDLRSFLTRRIWRLSFLLLRLLLGLIVFTTALSLSFKRWHAWMSFPSIWTLHLSKTLNTLASSKSLSIDVGIPTTSKHSRLVYWTLTQYCCFVLISWLTSFSLTFVYFHIHFLWNVFLFLNVTFFSAIDCKI